GRLQWQIRWPATCLQCRRTGGERQVRLAGASGAGKEDPIMAATDSERAQLGQRAIRRADEGFKSLVWRITQGQGQLRHTHFGSTSFNTIAMSAGGSLRASSTIVGPWPAYNSLWR